jgi:hypothetical protein
MKALTVRRKPSPVGKLPESVFEFFDAFQPEVDWLESAWQARPAQKLRILRQRRLAVLEFYATNF